MKTETIIGIALGLAMMFLVRLALDASPTEGLIVYFVVAIYFHVQMTDT